MLAKKTIKAIVLELCKGKYELLTGEYKISNVILAATKLFRSIMSPSNRQRILFILRNNIYRAETKLTKYWLKVPVHGVRRGIFVPIRPHIPIPSDVKFREAKIMN
jgi:hypothetical protein